MGGGCGVERPVPQRARGINDRVARTDPTLRGEQAVAPCDVGVVGDTDLRLHVRCLTVLTHHDQGGPAGLQLELLGQRGGLVEVEQVELLQRVNRIVQPMC